MRKFYFLILILILSLSSYSQTQIISGKVTDSKTNKNLPFVNISYNEKGLGTTTNINGEFIIKNPLTNKLYVSYIGYYNDTIDISNKQNKLNIKLKPKAYKINEITVFPGKNPAERIIQKVIKNKDINNPEKQHSFTYTSYNKNIFTIDFNTSKTKFSSDSAKQKLDSAIIKSKKFTEKQHLFLIESVSEREFLYPDLSNEKILASKTSGTSNPLFSMITTQLQSFSFYNDFITLFNKSYLNPISKGSIKKYLFLLEDTLYTQTNDTLFIISFQPRKGKNFKGLKGILHINTNKYAIQNVIANPNKILKNEAYGVRIQQKYDFVNNKQWFPKQLNTEIIFRNSQISTDSTHLDLISINKSYIKDIKLNVDLNKKDFDITELNISQTSTNKTENYWNKNRIEKLEPRDTFTYYKLDSIGKKYNIDKKLKIFETAMSGYIPISFFNLNVNQLYDYNLYEGIRLGIGGITNNKLSKWFAFGGHYAYGFKDKENKYGGIIEFNFNDKAEGKVSILYNNEVTEASGYNFSERKTIASSEIFRRYLIENMNKIEEQEVSYSFRAFKYLQSKIYFNKSTIIPTDGYTYQTTPSTTSDKFLFTETGIKLRYAFREKYIQLGRIKYPQGTNYPIIQANIIKGINELDGEYSYTKFETKISETFKSKSIGKTSVCIVSGIVTGEVPVTKLYNGHGSYYKFAVVSDNSFGAMRMNEFYSDKFLSVFFKQDFGHLLFSKKNFSPGIALVNNFGIGSLSNIDKHNFSENISTLEKGYFEAGIHFNNLINQSFFGYGVGIYYRYGEYSFKKTANNFAYKLSFTINL